jgi:hypothetical protein
MLRRLLSRPGFPQPHALSLLTDPEAANDLPEPQPSGSAPE